ncbi:MAG: DUF6544 family protein [Gemmatimonas sp.]
MLAILGTAKWKQQTATEIRKLSPGASPLAARAARYERAEIAALPAPVIRYFEFALTPGQPVVTGARIEWEGQFSMRPRRWSAFTATQHYRVQPPGFVWDARIWMTGVLPVLVRDSYADHEGSLRAAIGGIVKVADSHGTVEIAKGELLRYLAEAIWFPTALLPSAGVSWTAIDEDSATATLSDGATTVSLDAHFGASGAIQSLSAMRPRDVRGTSILTPWVAHVRNYDRRHGMMVPSSGDVEWELPSGPLPYWRGRVVSAQYDFAR